MGKVYYEVNALACVLFKLIHNRVGILLCPVVFTCITIPQILIRSKKMRKSFSKINKNQKKSVENFVNREENFLPRAKFRLMENGR